MWEGCMCGLTRDHEGLCHCISDGCGETWDLHQAKEFEKQFFRDS
jgi:hypothetical protein